MDGVCLGTAYTVPASKPALELAEERVLIRRAQRGDTAAFEELVRLYDQNVLRLTLQLVRSEEDARDLYQEAFLKIYRSLERFRFECRFTTWVYRVVMNTCLDYLRRHRSREMLPLELSDVGTELVDSLADARPAHDPEQALRSKEISQKIEAALNTLNPRERLVFELKHYQGLKLRTIGEMFGTTEETVKNCLFRATRKLRARLLEVA